ncbi:MAG: hypothetical protein EOM19_05735 [Candidatus Moranbacteria bacterium]|nr:hypothetical protein [Candidatus Moranbacteria bacterium]
MSYSKYNVAIIPTENISQLSRKVSSRLGSDVYFHLNSVDIFPHLSLYHVPLEQAVVKEVCIILESAIQSIPIFTITGKEYYCYLGGWVGISYEKNSELLALENYVLHSLKNLWCRDFASEYEDVSGEKGKNIQEYGWADAGLRFFPHITLSRMKKDEYEEVIAVLNAHQISEWSFCVERVGLFELDEHGTCTKLLQTFDLKTI